MLKNAIKYIGTMLQNKRYLFCSFLIVLILILLTSCAHFYEPAEIIAEYMVPFVETRNKWSELELVEQDDYGREIYCYTSNGSYTNVLSDFVEEDYNAPVLVYILCQKKDENFVYCYDKVSFMYIPSTSNVDEMKLTQWKNENDWNAPLVESKMVALSTDLKANGIYKYPLYTVEKDVVAALSKKINRPIDKYYLDVVFTVDANPVFVVREVIKWSDQSNEQIILGESFVFVVEDGNVTNHIKLSEDVYQWGEQIASIT